MKWNKELGTWSVYDGDWFKFDGTTPRNADSWSVTAEFGDLLISASVHYRWKYASFLWFPGNRPREFFLWGKHARHKMFPFTFECPCQHGSQPKTWLQKIRGPR